MKEIFLNKIKSKLALIFIIIVLFSQEYWLFSFLFLVWVILDLKNRQTYLLEIVSRNSNPVLYWIIVLMWLSFSIFTFMGLGYYHH